MDERHTERIHTEPALLDIGLDVGALVVHTGPDLCGREIEVSPINDDSQRIHTEVAARRLLDRPLYAGVFAQLPAGEYILWHPEPRRTQRVTIVGGEVVDVDWRPHE